MPVWLDVRVDGALYRSVVVPLLVGARQQVYAARHDLAAGALVGPGDFAVREEDVALLDSAPVALAPAAAAWRLRQAVMAGQVLTEHMLPPQGMIFRGDQVRLVIRSGGLGIEADGMALADAVPGQPLAVQLTSARGPSPGGSARPARSSSMVTEEPG